MIRPTLISSMSAASLIFFSGSSLSLPSSLSDDDEDDAMGASLVAGSVGEAVQNENGNRAPFLEILPLVSWMEATLSLWSGGVKQGKVGRRAKKGREWPNLWESEEEKEEEKKSKRRLVAVFVTFAIAAAVGRDAMVIACGSQLWAFEMVGSRNLATTLFIYFVYIWY